MPNVDDLQVHHRAHRLTLDVYEVTKAFPPGEAFGLVSQLRRATASIPMNLAEGCGRSSDRELARYVKIAQGSATEVEYQLRLSRDLGYLDVDTHHRLTSDTVRIKRMLHGLRKRPTS